MTNSNKGVADFHMKRKTSSNNILLGKRPHAANQPHPLSSNAVKASRQIVLSTKNPTFYAVLE
jgi:hypothetical protein